MIKRGLEGREGVPSLLSAAEYTPGSNREVIDGVLQWNPVVKFRKLYEPVIHATTIGTAIYIISDGRLKFSVL